MSNQVFSNSTQKYYGSRGLNFYTIPSSAIVLATQNSTNLVPFVEASPIQNTTDFTIIDGELVIQTEGMYSIQCEVAMQAGSTSIDPFAQLQLYAEHGLFASPTLLNQTSYKNVRNTPATIQKLCVSFVGYLAAGTYLFLRITNLGDTGAISSLQAASNHIACKIY